MPRYRLTIAYDGTDFCGWQKQFPHEDSVPTAPRMPEEERVWEEERPDAEPPVPAASGFAEASVAPSSASEISSFKFQMAPPRPRVELRTVQSVVERAVRHAVREPVMLQGASRTDAGVHARGQVAAFSTLDRATDLPPGAGRCEPTSTTGKGGGWPLERGTNALMMAVNARLPADVLVTAIEPAADEFDPIGGAVSKGYSYTIWCGPRRPMPFEHRYMLHIWRELDVAKMAAAAGVFAGEHDFAAFAAAGHGRATTVRTIHECGVRVLECGTGNAECGMAGGTGVPTLIPHSAFRTPHSDSPCRAIQIHVSGSGFLWNMVRIIAGTLVEVGRGKLRPDDIREALRTGDRRKAGPTLPPHGLCLEWIRYGV